MKELIWGLTLLGSVSASTHEISLQAQTDRALDKAELATNLWFCDGEEALKGLVASMDIESSLGCAKAIQRANRTLAVEDIVSVLKKHLVRLKQLQAFETQVKSGKGYLQLVPSVKALKANGLSLSLVKRFLDLTPEESVLVELCFKKSKTDLERAIERF